MLPSPKYRPHLRHTRQSQGAFTLIEVLAVIAVIAVLSALSFGIATGVKNSQSRSKAKGELAILALALEQYKSQYGDYPWVDGDPNAANDNGTILFDALLGWRKFERSGETTSFVEKQSTDVPPTGPKSYLDVSKLTYVGNTGTYPYEGNDYNPDLGSADRQPGDHVLLDPWGNPYVYLYGQTSNRDWEVFGYYLYSLGPDGSDSIVGLNTSSGVVNDESSYRGQTENIDNIYSGE